jgi:hypothetical protein
MYDQGIGCTRTHSRVYCSVIYFWVQACVMGHVCGVNRDAVLYLFRIEMVGANSIIFHNEVSK